MEGLAGRPEWCGSNFNLKGEDDEAFSVSLSRKPLAADNRSFSSSDCQLHHISRREADFLSIPVLQDPPITESPSTLSAQIKDSFELLLTFTAVVALWGAIDVIVEMISKENLPVELFTYIMFAVVALFVQTACNKLFDSNISLLKALDRF